MTVGSVKVGDTLERIAGGIFTVTNVQKQGRKISLTVKGPKGSETALLSPNKYLNAVKIPDSSISPKSGISYAGVNTSTKGWNAQMKKAYKEMTTTGGYGAKVAKQIINSQKNVIKANTRTFRYSNF